jgi:hypothetical protein
MNKIHHALRGYHANSAASHIDIQHQHRSKGWQQATNLSRTEWASEPITNSTCSHPLS